MQPFHWDLGSKSLMHRVDMISVVKKDMCAVLKNESHAKLNRTESTRGRTTTRAYRSNVIDRDSSKLLRSNTSTTSSTEPKDTSLFYVVVV
eukprot:scaffold364_cov224-Alexandrium_tamarense.AAC.9